MNLQEALAEIESPEFDTNVNVVSGSRAFFRAVAKEPSVIEASRLILESGDVREVMLGRIIELSAANIDMSYENPHDTPLAVLLWLTYYSAPELCKVAALYAANAANCWYATKLANNIIAPQSARKTRANVMVGGDVGNIGTSSSLTTIIRMMDYSKRYRFLDRAVPKFASTKIQDLSFGVSS
ncbi:MAG: hypothetical protein OXN21_13830 [Chloroflexota bacterium]|nr:hypothetical protein [Chloroflexota bacterium]